MTAKSILLDKISRSWPDLMVKVTMGPNPPKTERKKRMGRRDHFSEKSAGGNQSAVAGGAHFLDFLGSQYYGCTRG